VKIRGGRGGGLDVDRLAREKNSPNLVKTQGTLLGEKSGRGGGLDEKANIRAYKVEQRGQQRRYDQSVNRRGRWNSRGLKFTTIIQIGESAKMEGKASKR